jgi:hypothetical protein
MSTHINTAFSPRLESKRYAYYLSNGFNGVGSNDNVSIRWAFENHLLSSNRRHISNDPNIAIYITILEGSPKGILGWTSEEKIHSAIINKNDPSESKKYYRILESNDIPELDPDVIIGTNPYTIQIIPGSVTSNGKIQPDSRIKNGVIRYLFEFEEGVESIDPNRQRGSFKETVVERIPIVRSSNYYDLLPNPRIKEISDVYANENAHFSSYIPGTDYDFVIANGESYSNKIDWSKGELTGNIPEVGETYYVTYVYDKVMKLVVEFECDYNENEFSPQIWKSTMVEHTGQCSPTFDYMSDQLNINDFAIEDGVKANTLKFVVTDDNPRVRTYIENGRVIGTLDKIDPRESWNPYIKGGHYYIGKDAYYMFNNPKEYALDNTLIPIAEHVRYGDGFDEFGAVIEEGTQNLIRNSKFKETDTVEVSFVESFTL